MRLSVVPVHCCIQFSPPSSLRTIVPLAPTATRLPGTGAVTAFRVFDVGSRFWKDQPPHVVPGAARFERCVLSSESAGFRALLHPIVPVIAARLVNPRRIQHLMVTVKAPPRYVLARRRAFVNRGKAGTRKIRVPVDFTFLRWQTSRSSATTGCARTARVGRPTASASIKGRAALDLVHFRTVQLLQGFLVQRQLLARLFHLRPPVGIEPLWIESAFVGCH